MDRETTKFFLKSAAAAAIIVLFLIGFIEGIKQFCYQELVVKHEYDRGSIEIEQPPVIAASCRVAEDNEVTIDGISPKVTIAEEVGEDESNPPDVSVEYIGTFLTTAYCACEICCGDYASGYTASGTYATQGRTIACNILPFGTEVMIDGNTYVVEDTGSGIGEYWIDIFFEDHQEASDYGIREKEVYIVR